MQLSDHDLWTLFRFSIQLPVNPLLTSLCHNMAAVPADVHSEALIQESLAAIFMYAIYDVIGRVVLISFAATLLVLSVN